MARAKTFVEVGRIRARNQPKPLANSFESIRSTSGVNLPQPLMLHFQQFRKAASESTVNYGNMVKRLEV